MEKLSDEELVFRIQNGETELVEVLWNQIKGFVAFKGRKFLRGFQGWVEMDDYMQTGFLAMVKAIGEYKPGTKMKFLNTMAQRLLVFYRRDILLMVKNGQKNTWSFRPDIDADSLQEPLKTHSTKEDGGAFTRESTLTYREEESDFDRATEKIAAQQMLAQVSERIVDVLTPVEQDFLYKHFLEGMSYEEIATESAIGADCVKPKIVEALEKLRKDDEISKLKAEWLDEITVFYQHKGIAGFNSSGTSAVEDIVERRERMSHRYVERKMARWKSATYTNEVASQIYGMLKNGETPKTAAEKTGIPFQNVKYIMNRRDKIRLAEHADELEKQAAELKCSGSTAKEISFALEISDYSVKKLLLSAEQHGLIKSKHPRKYSDEIIQKVKELRSQGFTLNEIAEQLSLRYNVVQLLAKTA